MWHDVHDPVTGKLLFQFDPQRDLVYIKRGRIKAIIHLQSFRRRKPGRPTLLTRVVDKEPNDG